MTVSTRLGEQLTASIGRLLESGLFGDWGVAHLRVAIRRMDVSHPAVSLS
ncbi:MAG TPA: hypothetical protein VML56_11210 [Burkholderiales bacterium]|nr:hypothetical protein [Burkholderiales bacterium]